MLSVVIATRDSARPLVATLANLVPGAMRGIVREVIVADGGSADATIDIADGAGCSVIASTAPLGGRLAAAAASARARWLMFLRPGTILEPTWLDEIVRFVEESEFEGTDGTATFRRLAGGGRQPAKWRLMPFAAALFGRPDPGQGLVIGAARYKELGGHGASAADPEAEFLARIGRRRLVVLHSAARHA